MTEQSLKDRTAKGLFWGGISNGLQQIIGVIFGIILARTLNVEDYGLIGMLAIFQTIASTIQESGFTNALINRKEIDHEYYNSVFWFSSICGIVLYTILFFCAPLISAFYNIPELTILSRVLFLAFVINGIGIAQYAYMFKALMVKEQAKINTIALLVSGTIGIVLAFLDFAYWALVFQTIIYVSLSTILRWHFSPWHPSMKFVFSPLREMFGFSSKLFFSNIFHHISNNLFSVFLGRFYNVTQVGYYSQGQKWMYMGQTFIGSMINSIAQPVLVEAGDDKERQLTILRKMIRFGSFISFPLMFGLAFISEEFIIITLGEKWSPAIPLLQVFCIWGAFAFLWTLFSNLIMAYGKSSIHMWIIIFTCSSQLAVLFFTLKQGILFMLSFYIIMFFAGLVIQIYFTNHLVNLTYSKVFIDIIPYLMLTAISFLITWLITNNINNIYILLISKIFLSSSLYFLFLWKMNSIIFREIIIFLKNKLYH